MTSGRAGAVPAPLSPEADSSTTRARARRPGSLQKRWAAQQAQADRLARELHPNATRTFTNPAHSDGPVVEVFGENEMLGMYRLVGTED